MRSEFLSLEVYFKALYLRSDMKRSGILGILFAVIILLSGTPALAFISEEKTDEAPKEEEVTEDGSLTSKGQQMKCEYEPLVVLIRTKQGVNLETLMPSIGVKTKSIAPAYPKIPLKIKNKTNRSEIELRLDRTYKIVLNGTTIEQAIAKLTPYVEYAEPNYKVRAQLKPNDPKYVRQWPHKNMDSESAWDIAYGGANVTIAIVDTGVDYSHEDLAANMWRNPGEIPGNNKDDDNNGYVDDIYGYDFFNNDPDPKDDYGHGTHCAGIAGAVFNNRIGIAGISPTAKIMALKFLCDKGWGYLDGAAAALRYAADNGARVISNSWGGWGTSSFIQDAVDYAFSKGCFLAAAAGNFNMDTAYFNPANCKNVFAVAAIDIHSSKTWWSNYGAKVDVSAPGAHVFSTMPQYAVEMNKEGFPKNYAYMSGTSMACPHVAGEAALLLSMHPSYTPGMIAKMIRAGADINIRSDEYMGVGRIDLYDSVSLNGPYSDAVTAKISSPVFNDMDGPDDVQVVGTATGASYTLSYATTPYTVQWKEFDRGGSVSEGPLGKLNNIFLRNRDYFIKLTALDPLGFPVIDISKVRYDKDLLQGWPQKTDSGIIMSPVCADFDHDGNNELLAVSSGNNAYLWRSDGTLVPGWPKATGDNLIAGSFITTPAVADLDNDLNLEIIFPSTEKPLPVMHVWHHDGTEATGWPRPIPATGSYNLCRNAAVSDINGDGQLEIVVTVESLEVNNINNEFIEAYAFDRSGNMLSGWPVRFNSRHDGWNFQLFVLSDPALADLNNDLRADVIFAYSDDNECVVNALDGRSASFLPGWPIRLKISSHSSAPVGIAVADADNDGNKELFFTTWAGHTFGLDKTGKVLPGWPRHSGYAWSSASLSDLDNDGDLEIVMQNVELKTFIFHHKGTPLAGWPKRNGKYGQGFGFPYMASAPVMGDIDSDGVKDIVQGSTGKCALYAFDPDKGIKSGFPKELSFYNTHVYATPSLVDFDKDGKTEVIIGDVSGSVYVWKFGNIDTAKTGTWPVMGANLRRTYCPQPEVPPPPVITSIGPVSGPQYTSVTIHGSNFGPKQGGFGNKGVPVKEGDWNDSAITCEAPNYAAGDYAVTVTVHGKRSNAVNFSLTGKIKVR